MKKLSLYTIILSFLLISAVFLFPSPSLAHSLDFWPPSTPQTQNSLYGVTFSADQGLFVAVGEVGTILTSPDGVNWSVRSSGTVNWLGGITYGNGKFVTVGAYGTILTSSLGTTWHTETSLNTHHLNGIAFGNSTYVAVGVDGTILTSSDAATWGTVTSGTSHFLQGVIFSEEKNLFVAVGGSGEFLRRRTCLSQWEVPARS